MAAAVTSEGMQLRTIERNGSTDPEIEKQVLILQNNRVLSLPSSLMISTLNAP